jgi:S-adenosylmethionine uptake transporter
MVALQPTGAAFSPSALIALFGSTMFASAITITRKLRNTHWLTLIVWQYLGAGFVGAVAGPFDWIPPRFVDLILMFLVGVVSMLCFVCINRALRLAPASLLAPFHYTSIVWAVAFGWLGWGDLPRPNVWLGICIIVCSGLFVWHREQSKSRTEALSAVPDIQR